MQVTARYFAVLRERRGRSEERLDLPEGTTARQAFEQLFPGLELRVAFAVDQALAHGDTVLHDGAELAFLPPIGGG